MGKIAHIFWRLLHLAGAFALFTAAITTLQGKSQESAGPLDEIKDCQLVEDERNDGDTFVGRLPNGVEQLFRLYFINCPQTNESSAYRLNQDAAHFGLSTNEVLEIGKAAQKFTAEYLRKRPFTILTRWEKSSEGRKIAVFVRTDEGYLHELLVKKGFARAVGGKKTTLPEGTSPVIYQTQLQQMEQQAKENRVGAWQNSRIEVGSPAPTAPVTASTGQSEESGRCAATTLKGTQCTRKARAGSRFCLTHQRMAEAAGPPQASPAAK